MRAGVGDDREERLGALPLLEKVDGLIGNPVLGVERILVRERGRARVARIGEGTGSSDRRLTLAQRVKLVQKERRP